MNKSGYLIQNSAGKAVPWHQGGAYIYDPFNQDARNFVWQQVKAGYFDNGIKIYWLDAAEPERFLPDQSGQFYYKLGRDIQIGMAFPLFHQQTFFDGVTAAGAAPITFAKCLGRNPKVRYCSMVR